MCRFAYSLVLLGLILPTCWFTGCTVDVDAPGDPARVNVDADPPPKVDVDVDVKKTP